MPAWVCELFAGYHFPMAIIVKPCFARLETRGNGVLRFMKVFCRVLTRGAVATADVSTLSAAPEVQPPSTACEALNATAATWGGQRVNTLTLRFHFQDL